MGAWLTTHDPELVVVRRAVRVAVAAGTAFYLGRYGLGDSILGLYGAFTCIALGGLSDVSGPPRQRSATMLLAAAVGAGLVTLGTYLSVSTFAATAGMAVVGFLVAFAGIGGARVAGVANGWQLLYILPSFPPYDPGSLTSRLLGLGIGVVLLVLADRLLLPAPVPVPYPDVLVAAVAVVGDRLAVVRRLFAAEPVTPDELERARCQARHGVAASRLSAQPWLQRPSGPSRRDRALWAAASGVRITAARVDNLQAALQRPDVLPGPHRGDDLLRAAQLCLQQCAQALRGGDLPDVVALDEGLARTATQRQRWLVDAVAGEVPLDTRIAVGTATIEVAVATRNLALAVAVGMGGRLPAPSTPADRRLFWFAHAGPLRLGGVRLRGQLTLRSVWFRNALRVALALGTARALAGVLDLSHGFWVLLATLTLMRTTFSATRTAVGPAVLGTLVGAVVAVPLLVVLGADNLVLAVLLPLLIVVALAGGPLLGPAFGQAGFTLTVAALFAQVSSASWSLAGWRLLDVVVGAGVGVLAGLLAWPRGATGQLVRQCRDALRRSAEAMTATTGDLTRAAASDVEAVERSLREARRCLLYAGEGVGFAMGEPVASGLGPHWRELLDSCRDMVEGGQYLRQRRQADGPVPWPDAVALLERLAADASARADRLAAALPALPVQPAPAPSDSVAGWLRATVAAPAAAPGVLNVIDARGWLVAVRRDLDRLESARR